MKTIIVAGIAAIIGTAAASYERTSCRWITDNMYVCTTYGDGWVQTTRCTVYGGNVRCSSY